MKDEPVLEDISKKTDTRGTGMKILSPLLILVSISMLADNPEGVGRGIASMMGPSIVIAIISYLIWIYKFKKKGLGLLVFSVLFFALSIYQEADKDKNVYIDKTTANQTIAFEKEYKAILKDISTNKTVEPDLT